MIVSWDLPNVPDNFFEELYGCSKAAYKKRWKRSNCEKALTDKYGRCPGVFTNGEISGNCLNCTDYADNKPIDPNNAFFKTYYSDNEQAISMLSLREEGKSLKEIGNAFGVTGTYVRLVLNAPYESSLFKYGNGLLILEKCLKLGISRDNANRIARVLINGNIEQPENAIPLMSDKSLLKIEGCGKATISLLRTVFP